MMEKDQHMPAVISGIDYLEILLIVFNCQFFSCHWAKYIPILQVFKYMLKLSLNTMQHNNENCV